MSGFSFTSPSAPASSQGGGFSFGAGSTGGGAFSFGAPSTTTSANPPAFGFGSSAPATSANPPAFGFGSGAPTTTTTALPTFGGLGLASSASSFGAVSSTTTSAATPGFAGFGTPSTSSVSFGGFGATPATTTTAATLPTFGAFGGGNTSLASTPSFGAPSASAPTLSFGGSAATPAPAVSFGAAATTAPPAFSLTAKPTIAPAPVSAPTSTGSSLPSLGGFGSTAPATVSGMSSGFSGFGSSAAVTTSAGGFAFGGTSTSTSNPLTLSFGAPSVSQASSVPTTSTAAPVAVNPIGLALSSAPSSTSVLGFSSGTTSLTSAAPPIGGAFGVPKSTADVTTGATPATSLQSALSTPVTLTTTTQTTQSSAAPVSMNFRQLDEALNKWLLDLDEQEKVFLNQATQVNAWDRLLLNNGEKVVTLYEDVEKLKQDQQRLEHELDFVSTQQSELEQILQPLEALMVAAPPPDPERERIYSMAESLDAQLQRMAEDLRKVIDHINSANKNEDDSEPLSQIRKVLNAHMDSLQWIDENTALVQKRLDEVQKLHEIRRKDIERVGIL